MKQYEKPMLYIMALEGNEQLCGSCADAGKNVLLYKEKYVAEAMDIMLGNMDGKLEQSELNGVFGSGEGCQRISEVYCKFTGALTVAWS